MNRARFRAEQRVRPTDYIKAPQLAGILFDEGEPAHFKVRGLDANELFLAKERRSENNPVRQMVKALQESGQIKDGVSEALRSVFGDPRTATAAETAYRFELIVMGTIDEQGKTMLETEDVAKLSEHYPGLFLEMSSKILKLSGEDSVSVGEASGRSGAMIASGEPSTSAMPAGNSSFKSSRISSHINGSPT